MPQSPAVDRGVLRARQVLVALPPAKEIERGCTISHRLVDRMPDQERAWAQALARGVEPAEVVDTRCWGPGRSARP